MWQNVRHDFRVCNPNTNLDIRTVLVCTYKCKIPMRRFYIDIIKSPCITLYTGLISTNSQTLFKDPYYQKTRIHIISSAPSVAATKKSGATFSLATCSLQPSQLFLIRVPAMICSRHSTSSLLFEYWMIVIKIATFCLRDMSRIKSLRTALPQLVAR